MLHLITYNAISLTHLLSTKNIEFVKPPPVVEEDPDSTHKDTKDKDKPTEPIAEVKQSCVAIDVPKPLALAGVSMRVVQLRNAVLPQSTDPLPVPVPTHTVPEIVEPTPEPEPAPPQTPSGE